ncbi:hypothetical protein BB559_005410 [Furculomyces boomerangus]|uniref:Myb-like domain-containing protein n=1 Tax=Furculomyces boomerangus TaxID=61424 RepID=A0A2T9Y8V6_9FUNG|nr:hypothetical protein BB559_007570 [Furculomyces boomerangus]PVU84554.1 hypothetical protein BB559_007581 [Furculomyces boomerangus]PVU88755.1 hypothetical protein BB559_005410 [Furculomyces boomerangus]
MHTSLRVDKSNTKFAPKIKQRIKKVDTPKPPFQTPESEKLDSEKAIETNQTIPNSSITSSNIDQISVENEESKKTQSEYMIVTNEAAKNNSVYKPLEHISIVDIDNSQTTNPQLHSKSETQSSEKRTESSLKSVEKISPKSVRLGSIKSKDSDDLKNSKANTGDFAEKDKISQAEKIKTSTKSKNLIRTPTTNKGDTENESDEVSDSAKNKREGSLGKSKGTKIAIPGSILNDKTSSTESQIQEGQKRKKTASKDIELPEKLAPKKNARKLELISLTDYEVEDPEEILEKPMWYFCQDTKKGKPTKGLVDRHNSHVRKKQMKVKKGTPDSEESLEPKKESPSENISGTSTNINKSTLNNSAAQVRIVDGKLVIDQESLHVNRKEFFGNDGELAYTEIDETHQRKLVNSMTYMKKKNTSKRWSKEETIFFFKQLKKWGTDFDSMITEFPGRVRTELKNKYKTEERKNPHLVDIALISRPSRPHTPAVTSPVIQPSENQYDNIESSQMESLTLVDLKAEQQDTDDENNSSNENNSDLDGPTQQSV